MTTFELTKKMHEAFGIENKKEIGIPNKEVVKLALDLIKEELRELEEAIGNNNILEVVDAFGDLDVVVNAAALKFGVPMHEVAIRVYNSNMSKFCKGEKAADDAILFYINEKGIECYKKLVDKETDTWAIFNLKTNKILKGLNFTTPNFEDLV